MGTALDNNYIGGLAGNPAVLAEFPLFGMKIEHKACCGRVTGHSPDYDNIRRAIAGLPDDQKARLREIINAGEVTVHYNDGGEVKVAQF